ncbi:MAG: excisionase family DNA-binding protein [Micropruina sp.]
MAAVQSRRSRVQATEREARLAREVLQQLEGPQGVLAVERSGQRVESLPPEIGRLLQQVLDVVARGGTITIGAIPDVVTTSSAAGILGISRPTLMKMIREEEIPAHRVGTHHRLHSFDVFAALKARRARERAAFLELMEAEGDEL